MLEVGDFVVRNASNWTPSDFDAWGAGEGVGIILEIIDSETIDVRWPGGRCYQRPDELIKKEI
ncbi:MAG: hypothetical protein M0R80_00640 [Proteobacteria bacterium]|jgi:hypothetical protein|nr:hypothetical protein [Pseudomonadota bacterium]